MVGSAVQARRVTMALGAAATLSTANPALAESVEPVGDTTEPEAAASPSGAPTGPLALAGVAFTPQSGGNVAFRLDVGLPLPMLVPGFRAALATTFDHESVLDIDVTAVAPFVTGQYLPTVVRTRSGSLRVGGELGLGPTVAIVSLPDQPYEPAHTDTDIHLGMRIAGAVEYGFDNGFIIAGQPLGMLVAFADDTDTALELGLRLGYQLP